MPKKQKIIFITVFVIVGIIVLGIYLWINRVNTGSTNETTPWYQNFNPFSSGTTNPDSKVTGPDEIITEPEEQGSTSRFLRITDFAVSGAMFLTDTRPLKITDEPKEVKTIIDSTTKEGRVKIQGILNTTLSLKKPLTEDGNFGAMTISALKEFQKLNSVPVTGKLDAETIPLFTEIKTSTDTATLEAVPAVRYVERMNGHIYKMFLDNKEIEKISNSTIPSIHEAVFDKTGETVIYRYLSVDKLVNSFVATLGTIAGEYLPTDISDLSVSSDKTKFFYLTKGVSGVVGSVRNFSTGVKNIVFSSPYTEWLSDWDAKGNVYLTTKASYSVPGNVYLLNQASKTISKVFGGVNGLTTKVSPNGTSVLYSTSTKTGPTLGLFTVKDHSVKDLDTYGLPEKCAWSSDNISVYCAIPSALSGGEYPDNWYQGLVSFDDYFVKINTTTGDKITIADSTKETSVDGVSLFLDNEESNLFFINKKDYTFWKLDIR